MSSLKLEGVFPAFATPTVPGDGGVDLPGLRKLLEYLIDNGAYGLVPVGGTGEFTAMSPAARLQVVRETVKIAAGRVPVVPGVLSPGFSEAVETGLSFKDAGVDALMLITPFYVQPSQAGIRDYFRRFRAEVDLPLMLYDIPSRTQVVTAPETIRDMVDDGVIIGLKACNPDINHFNHVAAMVADRIAIMSGEDTHFPVHMALGASGGVLATATLLPRYWTEIYAMAKHGRIDQAIAAQRRVLPLLDAIFAEANPGPLKFALRMAGFPVGDVITPLNAPRADTIARLKAAMESDDVQALLRQSAI